MPSIFTPNLVTVEMIYTFGSQRVENVYNVTRGAEPSLAQLTALWTIFRDWENVTAKAVRGNGAALVLIKCASRSSAGAGIYEAAVTPAITGSLGLTGVVTTIQSLVVKHLTGQSGRAHRGRTYWIAPNTTGGTSELASQVVCDALVTAFNTLRASLLAGGWTMVVASLYEGVNVVNGYRRAIPRSAGIMTTITSHTCERGWDTQRHRKLPYQV